MGYGGTTDSKLIDAQAGLEATFSIMNAFLSRCTLVHDVGYIEYGSTSSMELVVMCDEIIRMTHFVAEEIQVDANTLALDAISQVQPCSGFIAEDHTFENFRTAQWKPSVLDRAQYEGWERAGAKDMYARANQRARAILSDHMVPPLPAEAEAVIKEIFEERSSEPE